MSNFSLRALFDEKRYFGRLMNAVSTALLRRPTLRFEVGFSVGAVLLSTILRSLLDGVLPPGFPFLTFFPAVMLTLVFASTRAGVAVAAICGVIAWIWFIPNYGTLSLTPGGWLAIGFYFLIVATDILFIAAARWALEELLKARQRAEDMAHSRALMFSELQHRVSNNLQTVAALLRLQGARTPDEAARNALSASEARILAISRLQRRLHAPDLQTINAAEYLREILQDTLDLAADGTATMNIDADDMQLSNDVALPLGLIASELMMNAIEHGLSESRSIDVTFRVGPPDRMGRKSAVLRVRDYGSGLPAGFDIETADSLGLMIARQFATGLDGNLAIENSPTGGTVAEISFLVAPPVAIRKPDLKSDTGADSTLNMAAA